MTTYQVIILVLMAICVCQGFAVTSRGSIFTETVKNSMSVLAGASLVTVIVSAIVSKSLIVVVAAVVVYFLFTGAGQTIALVLMGRARQISPFSWVFTILSVVAAYCVICGRIVVLS